MTPETETTRILGFTAGVAADGSVALAPRQLLNERAKTTATAGPVGDLTAVAQTIARGNYGSLYPEGPSHVIARFEELEERWLDEVGFSSLEVERCVHPAYQQIIGLGRAILPTLLERAAVYEDWNWALEAITGERIAEGLEGDVSKICETWVAWGRERRPS